MECRYSLPMVSVSAFCKDYKTFLCSVVVISQQVEGVVILIYESANMWVTGLRTGICSIRVLIKRVKMLMDLRIRITYI